MTYQPYQEAAEETKRQSEFPAKLLKKGAAIAGLIAGSAPIIARIAPLLSKFIPQDMAIKGLSKVDARLGKFINSAMKLGHSFDDVKDFIGEKIQPGQQTQTSQEPSSTPKQEALRKAQEYVKSKRPVSELSRESLMQQVQGQQPDQSKAALQSENTDSALIAALERILRM